MDIKFNSNILKTISEYFVLTVIIIALLIWTIFKRTLLLFTTKLKKLDGEIAVITGAGSGIGRLVALRLIRLNATVIVIDINQKGINDTVELCKRLGGQAFGYHCDISKREKVYEVAKRISEEVGTVSILVNNAGIVCGQFFLNTPDAMIQKTMDVNIMAHFWTTKAFLPAMIERNHGHIVNVASMAGLVGLHKLVDYCSSKFAAVGFHLALRLELEQLGKSGIETSVICPYFIKETGMFNDVSTRFLPLLKSNDVADRILLAIRRNDNVVFLPGYFKILVMWKDVIPWEFVSIFLRNLVPDAMPDHVKAADPIIINNNNNEDTIDDNKMKVTGKQISDSFMPQMDAVRQRALTDNQ